MYQVSTQGVDELMINVHYYYYYRVSWPAEFLWSFLLFVFVCLFLFLNLQSRLVSGEDQQRTKWYLPSDSASQQNCTQVHLFTAKNWSSKLPVFTISVSCTSNFHTDWRICFSEQAYLEKGAQSSTAQCHPLTWTGQAWPPGRTWAHHRGPRQPCKESEMLLKQRMRTSERAAQVTYLMLNKGGRGVGLGVGGKCKVFILI